MTQLRGSLERWDDDKGFGFIAHIDYPKGVFVHISAFKQNINRRPIVGDMITYELFKDADGKRKAVNARIEGVPLPAIKNAAKKYIPRQKNNIYRKQNERKSLSSISTLVILGITIFALSNYLVTNKAKETTSTSPITTPQTQYSCQGKTYCSEMSSCEEAQFYQNNCSGTKMDGDGDGRPCEDMCGH